MASMAPSAAPAPTRVCSSSMKRMIWPFDSSISLSTALRRSSNSPRILCAGEHRAQVERDDALVAQDLGHVAGDDAAREAFDDGGLADAGFADEHGVVLGAAREHLDDAANLFVAANDGVEFAAACEFGEILGVVFERLEFGFRILVGHALDSPHGGQALQNRVVSRAAGRRGAIVRHRSSALRARAADVRSRRTRP